MHREETRHSGYFSKYEGADEAQVFVAQRMCPATSRARYRSRLAGQRIYFVGDSVIRQFSQSFMCRLRRYLQVVSDDIPWSVQWPSNRWGTCHRFDGDMPLRHCFMREGCVTFEYDVHVCYQYMLQTFPMWTASEHGWSWLPLRLAQHGTGNRATVVATHGMHAASTQAQWLQLLKHGPAAFQKVISNISSRAKVERVYKELDVQHFPTKSGMYGKSANRTAWSCKPVDPADPLPPVRALELQLALPIVKQLGWRVMETFAHDLASGASLHASQAPVPSRTRPVDCLHWMLPGIPDLWTESLLRRLVSGDGHDVRGEKVLP